MRRDFILVGLLLAVFVFPYVLTIEESSAEGLGCPNSLGIGEKIRCLESKLREQNVKVRNLEKSIAESGQARFVLSSQLNDCRMDSPSTNLGPRSSNAIPVFWGVSKDRLRGQNDWVKSVNKTKIIDNVNNARQMMREAIQIAGIQCRNAQVEKLFGHAEDNIVRISECANAYPSGC